MPNLACTFIATRFVLTRVKHSTVGPIHADHTLMQVLELVFDALLRPFDLLYELAHKVNTSSRCGGPQDSIKFNRV